MSMYIVFSVYRAAPTPIAYKVRLLIDMGRLARALACVFFLFDPCVRERAPYKGTSQVKMKIETKK